MATPGSRRSPYRLRTPRSSPAALATRRAALALALASFASLAAHAQPMASSADAVKAAYIHKFIGYIEWPGSAFDDASAPFRIGVVGADGVYSELARLAAGRPVLGRPVAARRLGRADLGADVHLLFVGGDAPQSSGWLDAYRNRPTLIVTEAARALDAGAMLNFVLVEDKVRFEAAPANAERAGLRLSARLLAVAERVLSGARP